MGSLVKYNKYKDTRHKYLIEKSKGYHNVYILWSDKDIEKLMRTHIKVNGYKFVKTIEGK